MKRLISIIFLLTTLCCLSAQENYGREDFERSEYISTQGDTLRYRWLAPQHMAEGEKYPLILFLHGAGERGTDNETQLVHGGQMFLNPVVREEYPAYVLAPQCPPPYYWAYQKRPSQSFAPEEMPTGDEPPTPIFIALKELLDTYLAMPQVDKSRIYVMGLSMGAMATFDIVARYPEIFAAAVPICGSVNPARLSAAKDVVFSIYHGDKDTVVPVESSRIAYRILKALGAQVRYKEFVGCTHGSWNPAFNEPDFFPWLFSQKKPFRAMSYNIHVGKGLDKKLDLTRIARVINEAKPHFVGLQEVDSAVARTNEVAQVEELARLTGMRPIYAPAIPHGKGKYGIAALVREEPLAIKQLPLPGAEEKRTFLLLEYKDYLLCNTHFSLTPESRMASIALINGVLKEYDKPAIFTGDFNLTPDSPEFQEMGKAWTLLTDTSVHTFPADTPDRTIDYIWASKRYPCMVKRQVVIEEKVASDHRPVFVDVLFE